jgi:hypothetical protein
VEAGAGPVEVQQNDQSEQFFEVRRPVSHTKGRKIYWMKKNFGNELIGCS